MLWVIIQADINYFKKASIYKRSSISMKIIGHFHRYIIYEFI